ncbi:hypothetical protein D3C72_529940 [compost metagenome]
MLTKNFLITVSLAGLLSLSGCKQELPKEVAQDNVFGTVQNLRTTADEKMLVYTQGADPAEKSWGKAGGYYITVDGTEHVVHWDQSEKFKTIKAGDKVNLHPSEYIACVGESDLKPTCRRMMRIYKSERRIDPLLTQ